MQLPGIVFARGGAVAILMLLESDKETFVVLTEQVSLKYTIAHLFFSYYYF